MKNIYHTHYCKDLSEKNIGQQVTISGWVENIRDHGGVTFVDIRDTTDILQIVSNDNKLFKGLSKESVICISGVIRKRSKDTINPKLLTGKIELLIDKFSVLSKSKSELPFPIFFSKNTKEDIRLKYRYLDLRNNKIKDNLILRSKILHFLRNKMFNLGFVEVQTPILTASSPEGARDFVVPSRVFKGRFYALPQAPQIYKELLMVGGFEKYFQIAPCFRDEDARSDRTLEFYQLDLEMSFVTEEDILKLGEDIFYDVFKTFSNKKVSPKPFRRITYNDALEMYGTDKPDLRNPLIIQDISHILKETTFKPFQKAFVKAIKVDGIGDKPNSWFNEVVDYATSIGMPGIGYITLTNDGSFKGPITKFLSDKEKKELIASCKIAKNSVLFFIANRTKKLAQKYAGLIRDKLGQMCQLIDHNCLELCIINDFPMFEYDLKTKKYDFCHNPFSLPKQGIKAFDNKNLDDILAYQYDFVCNGSEIASGAIRNHDLNSLTKAFGIVGYSPEEVKKRFQSIFTAFQYGCPPHGGMAPGIDRIIMLIQDESNLREVQAFPTSASGQDLMMGSPSLLTKEQLDELGIMIKKEDK